MNRAQFADLVVEVNTRLWQDYINHIAKRNELIHNAYMKQPWIVRLLTPRIGTTFSRWQYQQLSYDGFMAYLWNRRAR